MSEPDFESYKRYMQMNADNPVIIVDGGKPGFDDDYITVDFNGFRGLSAEKAESLAQIFTQAAKNRYDSDIGKDIRADIADARSGTKLLADTGGGINHVEQRVILIDSATASFAGHLEESFSRDLSGKDPQQQRLFGQYVREHETAHQILDLDEAGADYVASRRLLEKFPGPETEKFLQTMADTRVLWPYRSPDSIAGQVASSYGYGCSIAIEAAIAESRQGGKLTVEELHANAETYDALNSHQKTVAMEGSNNRVRPEMAVRRALLAENPDISADQYQTGSIARAADKLLKSGKFETGSVQAEILEEVSEAATRIDNVIVKMPNVVTPAPSVAPAMAAGMS